MSCIGRVTAAAYLVADNEINYTQNLKDLAYKSFDQTFSKVCGSGQSPVADETNQRREINYPQRN